VAIALEDGPRAAERMIDDGHLQYEPVRVTLVEIAASSARSDALHVGARPS
jgi:hypothetical protein